MLNAFMYSLYNPITNKPFVCDRVNQLRRRLSTDRNETWQIDSDRARERYYGNRFGKCRTVAMEIWKCRLKG